MKFYLLGDIHGNFKNIRDLYQRCIKMHKEKDNILICLGDFGANFFFNKRDEVFKTKLGKYPFTYFVVRGNHEERPSICAEKNPEAWTIENYFGNFVWVEKAFPYIKYAMDIPTVYFIDGYKTLVLPGAYSVDKWRRLQMDWSWFPKEQLSAEEMENGKALCSLHNNMFDLILSHTCPICFEPTDLFLSIVDQSKVDKSMEQFFGELEYKMHYKVWCWGHYHAFREYPRKAVTPSFTNPRQLMLYETAVELNDAMTSSYVVKEW